MESLSLSSIIFDSELLNNNGTNENATRSNSGTSDCIQKLDDIQWTHISYMFSMAILLCLDVAVIVGNTMVIMAVYYTCKLRSVTNLFIVSLAVADLMVGIVVLPFSATRQVYEVWIFGDFLCSVWLAVDVWMCTASILNLCAISLDRYVAVTRPVYYPNIMSMKRARILVTVVWILSFLICFPPLLGWKEKKHKHRPTDAAACPLQCELTDNAGYVIYSAFGSFFIPMFVMLFFYWKIYRAAAQTTKAINQGFRTTKTTMKKNHRFDETRMTLRMHRGKGSSVRRGNSTSTLTTSSTCNSVENSPGLRSPDSRLRRTSTRRHDRGGTTPSAHHDPIKISVSYPSTDGLNSIAAAAAAASLPESSTTTTTTNNNNNNGCRSGSISSSSMSNSGGTLYAVHCPLSDTTSSVFRATSNHLRVNGGRLSTDMSAAASRRYSAGAENYTKTRRHMSDQLTSVPQGLSPSPSFDDGSAAGHKSKLIAKMGKRNIKSHVKKFKMETKAAKTLGIIVGGFILCWMPFFTIYLVSGITGYRVSDTMFAIMFWLGYCNSAINPMIYALFSKDFRFAFRRIIYSCFSKKFSLRDSKTSRRGSDGSQLGTAATGCKRSDRSPSYQEFEMAATATVNANVY